MICDTRSTFCNGTAVDGGTGVANIGDVIDTQAPGISPNLLVGHGGIYLVVSAKTDILAASATGSFAFKLVSDAVTVPDTTTSTLHAVSRNFNTTTSAATTGAPANTILWVLELPKDLDYERYLGVQIVRNTVAIASGAQLHAFLTEDARAWKALADAAN